MKLPINFEKINDENFTFQGDSFRIEADKFPGVGAIGSVWCFPVDDKKYENCLYFEIDWPSENFSIKTSAIGNGKNWCGIVAAGLPLHKKYCISMDNFLSFIKGYVILNTNSLLRN